MIIILCEKSSDVKIVKKIVTSSSLFLQTSEIDAIFLSFPSFFPLFHPDQIISTLMRQHYLHNTAYQPTIVRNHIEIADDIASLAVQIQTYLSTIEQWWTLSPDGSR